MAKEFLGPAQTASHTTTNSEPFFSKGKKEEPFFKSAISENSFSNQIQAQTEKPVSTEYLVNNSSKTVFYKPESSGDALPLSSKGKLTKPIDGVATFKFCDKVFKVRGSDSGATAVVDKNGDVEVANYLLGTLTSGWKDSNWLKELQKKGDTGWDKLFMKSKATCK